MLGRILPALAITAGSYLLGKGVQILKDKAVEAMSKNTAKKSSAPKDLGTLDYDAESNSYRPKN